MLESKAYTVQMNVDVPDAERRTAEKASESFESIIAQIKLALEHLDLIYTPFSKKQNIDADEVAENRAVLKKYSKKTKDIFDKIIESSFKSVSLMSEFSTDSAVEELMGSFVSSVKELEKQVNILISIFSNLSNPEFRNQLLQAIDSVRKQSSQLRQLVNDRVLEHIDTNILAKNWESLVNDKYQDKIKSKTPLIVELYQERQEALK